MNDQSGSIENIGGGQPNMQDMSRNPASGPSGNPKKYDYARELKEQMQKNQEKKMKEIMRDRNLDHQMLRERIENDPFGRAGSGAPKRDMFGNVITKRLKSNENAFYDPRMIPNGNEGIPTKPYAQLPGVGNSFDPLPGFSLKAQLARNNIVNNNNNIFATPQMNMRQPPMMQNQGYQQQLMQQGYDPRRAQSLDMDPYRQQMQPPMQQGPNSYQTLDPNYPQPQGYGDRGRAIDTMPPGFELSPIREEGNRSVQEAPLQRVAAVQETIQKQKKMQQHLEHQKELLMQIEEKKRRKEEEEMRKKEEDAREEARVKREADELAKADQNEFNQRRNLHESVKQENRRLMNKDKQMNQTLRTNDSVVSWEHVVQSKKKSPRRPRTPIEEVEALNQTIKSERERVTVHSQIIKELPIEVEKTIHNTVNNELSDVKREIISQQQNLHDQLLELRKQVQLSNKERFDAQKEIDELKYNLKQQNVQEEIRRTELYGALMKTYTQPAAILPTITKIESERELSNREFEFPRRPPHMRYVGREIDRDPENFDQLLTNTKMVDLRAKPERMVQQLDARPDSQNSNFDATQSGVKYLNYFNLPEGRQGIRVDETRTFAVSEEAEPMINNRGRGRGKNSTRYSWGDDNNSETGQTVTGILQRNNQRLDILDEIEHKEFGRYGSGSGDLFTSPPSDFDQIKKHGMGSIEEEKYDGQDMFDDLIEKINNPRKYLYRD